MRPALSLALVAAAPALLAQTLQTLPLPGLWEQKFEMLVDGRDVMAQMRSAQAQLLAALPPEQRRQMQALLQLHGAGDGSVRQCLPAADVARLADAQQALAQAMRGQQHCTSDVVSVVGSTVNFEGRCTDPNGMTGSFAGSHTQRDARHWVYALQGSGRMAGAGRATVAFAGKGTGRWIGADCGAAAR